MGSLFIGDFWAFLFIVGGLLYLKASVNFRKILFRYGHLFWSSQTCVNLLPNGSVVYVGKNSLSASHHTFFFLILGCSDFSILGFFFLYFAYLFVWAFRFVGCNWNEVGVGGGSKNYNDCIYSVEPLPKEKRNKQKTWTWVAEKSIGRIRFSF